MQGEDYFTDPKTEKSNRTVSIPDFLCEELEEYIAMLYGFKSDDRMFQITKSYLHHEMERGAKRAVLKICCIFGRFCYTMNRSKCLPFVMQRGIKKHNE